MFKKKKSGEFKKTIPFTRNDKKKVPHSARIPDAPASEFAFSDIRMAWVWLIVRLYVGYEWLSSGWGKLGSSAWVGDNAGAAITGFINRALEKTTGAHPDVQGWYAWFLEQVVLPNAQTMSYLIVIGEILVGIALILGIFTGIAAGFGLMMNSSFLLGGAISINPILIFFEILLVMAYRIAGWYGADRYILRWLGTPWAPGHLFVLDDCDDKT